MTAVCELDPLDFGDPPEEGCDFLILSLVVHTVDEERGRANLIQILDAPIAEQAYDLELVRPGPIPS